MHNSNVCNSNLNVGVLWLWVTYESPIYDEFVSGMLWYWWMSWFCQCLHTQFHLHQHYCEYESQKLQYFPPEIIQSVYVNVFNFFSLLRDHIDAVSARLDMLVIRQLDVSLGNHALRSVSTPVTITLTASFSGTVTSPALYVYTYIVSQLDAMCKEFRERLQFVIQSRPVRMS